MGAQRVTPAAGATPEDLRESYLRLLERSILGQTVGPATLLEPVDDPRSRVGRLWRLARRIGFSPRTTPAHPVRYDLGDNAEGERSVWSLPPWALSMIGTARMGNLRSCVEDVLENQVPGDLIEAGVWRGGATVFMRGILRAHGVTDRTVVVADSFRGVPPPDTEHYPQDDGLTLYAWPGLAVGLEDVRAAFERYDLLDDQVEFVEGWFRDSLPPLRDRRWSVVRLDGDLYESTMDGLTNLYDGLAVGGWLIVDDHEIPACAEAVQDFRAARGIDEPIIEVDWTGICWQKSRA